MSDHVPDDVAEEQEERETPETEEIVLRMPSDGTGGERIDKWLVPFLPQLSRTRIQSLLREGHISITGLDAVAPGDVLKESAEIRIRIPPPAPIEPEPENIPLDIVYEDEDCLVINKPAGLVVHPSPGHDTGTLVNALLFHCRDLRGIGGRERPGIVHRLDKDTSGLMVAAKTDAGMRGFGRLFMNGKIHKEYICLVHGKLPQEYGTIETLIGRHPVLRQHWAVVQENGKRAVTHYHVERVVGPVSLVRVRIETGRTHQIRVHMASLHCPIIGDAYYGRPSADARLTPVPFRQMLHSTQIIFEHPVSGVPMDFTVPPPPDFLAYL